MKIFQFLLLIALAACSGNQKELSPEESRADLFYSHGTAALMEGDFTKALEKLNQANRLKPNDSNILNNLGMSYYFKKRPENAISLIKKSLEINPENADARNNLAAIYYTEKNYNEALKQYKIVLDDLEYPAQFRVYYNVALIYLQKGDTYKSIENLKSSLEAKSDYCPSHFLFGDIYFANGDYPKALQSYKKSSLGTCTGDPKPHNSQAETYMKMGKFIEAKQKYEEIILTFPSSEYATLAQKKIDSIGSSKNRLLEEINRTEHLFKNSKEEIKKAEATDF
jgi:tetratricopeptide (TPR) repeat protein